MSSTQASNGAATTAPGTTAVGMKLEAVVVPVTDVDRAKAFYEGLGWRMDGDFPGDDGYRVVQMTPPGSSNASIIFGAGVTSAPPGSIDSILLAVDDIDAALADLRAPGHDPERRSYASFDDPDGNTWLLQEITERLPGRV